jgi:hypothetical protein
MKTLLKTILLLIIFSVPVLALAQGLPPEDPVDTPIDGGLSVLLAAGAAYGVKRMRKKKVDGPQSTDDGK